MKTHFIYPEWLIAWNATAILLLLRSLARESPAVPSWQAVGLALLVVASAAIARWMLHGRICSAGKCSHRQAAWASLSLTPGVVTFAFWLSTLDPSTIATVFLWAIVITSELVWFAYDMRAGAFSEASNSRRASRDADAPTDPDSPLADEVDSQIERSCVDGHQQISGLLRVRYEREQRHATAVAGFAPPLRGEPSADAEVVWGDDATVKVVEIHAQGVRFEVSRDGDCDDAGSTIIEFFTQTIVEA